MQLGSVRFGAVQVNKVTWATGRDPGALMDISLTGADRKTFQSIRNAQNQVVLSYASDMDNLYVYSGKPFDWKNETQVRSLGMLLENLQQQLLKPALKSAMPSEAPHLIQLMSDKFDQALTGRAFEKFLQTRPELKNRPTLLNFLFSQSKV